VLLFEFVFRRTGRRIAAQPELIANVLALFIGLDPPEGGALLVTDDVTTSSLSHLSQGEAFGRGGGAACANCVN
jgi:hypothetical protein